MEKEEIKEEVKEEIKEEKKPKKERNTKKPLVTCRVLFISVLDKILFALLALGFVFSLFSIFRGNFSSPSYGYWRRLLDVIALLISTTITYLIVNWFYRCAAKTMLCITEHEIYKEKYVPFKRGEKSIPLNKVTSVTTINLFWIFRSVIIFQYHHIPMIFFTWKNQEFKDQYDELVNKRTEKIENEFEDKSIITFLKKGFIKKFFIGVAAVVVLFGIIRFFGYIFSPARKVPGTYVNGENKIVLNKDGSCEVDPFKKDIIECTWNINDDANIVTAVYKYKSTSWLFGESTSSASISFNYEKNKLTYNDVEYTK